MMQATCLKTEHFGNHDDIKYANFLSRMNQKFQSIQGPLFTTNAEMLFETYLSHFPDEIRQHHNCHACRHFIEKFGGLVTISETGETMPAIWHPSESPDEYIKPILAMYRTVKKAKITGVFYSSEKVWGQPVTGIWHHFYVKPQTDRVFNKLAQTASQAMAEKKEDFKNVIRAMSEFTLPMIEQALKVLKADALYRSEKVIGPAQWLYDLHNARKGKMATNIMWRAIATAPAGFCHPRSSMIGTLLEDIASGMDFETISKRFAAKMHPLQYLRPQVAPSTGNIEQAEKVIEKMGVARSLERRFATINEVDTLWIPTPLKNEPPSDSVFGHLKPKSDRMIADLKVPPIKITWVKFEATVMPEAKEIEIMVPTHGDFIALISATFLDAPPILRWDTLEKRNPVSWYRYHNRSNAFNWGLKAYSWATTTAICLPPSRWFGSKSTHSKEAMFIIKGAVDTQSTALALFPEDLKSELHGIRSTIEAYSRSKRITGAENASACGICAIGAHVRVSGIEYKIDRWD